MIPWFIETLSTFFRLSEQGVVTTLLCALYMYFHLWRRSRNLIVKMKAWSFDSSLETCLIAWSTVSSILIAWFLVVNGHVYKDIRSATPIYRSCVVCRIKNLRKIAIAGGRTGHIAVTTPRHVSDHTPSIQADLLATPFNLKILKIVASETCSSLPILSAFSM